MVSYASQLQPIWNASCTTNCHGGNRPSAGLNLVSGASYGSLVNVPGDCGKMRVLPGAPDNSYLVNKLTGPASARAPRCRPRAFRWPPQLDLIRGSICQGAPNN